MPWNLLILPLVAGYFLVTRLYSLKHDPRRNDRQRLIFDSIIYGALIISITFLIRYGVELICPCLVTIIHNYFPVDIPFIGTTSASLVLTVIFTRSINYIHNNNSNSLEFAYDYITDYGNELQILARDSILHSKLIEFTLDTGKVYIGYVKESVRHGSNYVRIIPIVSGYRDDRKELHITTHYLNIIKENFEGDYDLVITIDNIVSLSYFDFEVYNKFNSTKGKTKPE